MVDLPDGPWFDDTDNLQSDKPEKTTREEPVKFGDGNVIIGDAGKTTNLSGVPPTQDEPMSTQTESSEGRIQPPGICTLCHGDGGIRGGCLRCGGSGYVW